MELITFYAHLWGQFSETQLYKIVKKCAFRYFISLRRELLVSIDPVKFDTSILLGMYSYWTK